MTDNRYLISINKVDDDKRIVYSVVYPSMIVDTYGDFTDGDTLRKAAHDFMRDGSPFLVDTMHDESPNGSYVIESYMVEDEKSEYPKDSWVVGIKVENRALWDEVKSGKINGISLSFLARSEPVVAEIDVDKFEIKETKPGGDDNHTHLFWVTRNDDGRIVDGLTSTDNGHSHKIRRGTATEQTNKHGHRLEV